MAENNKMKDMQVNKLMIQMGITLIAIYNLLRANFRSVNFYDGKAYAHTEVKGIP